MRRTRFPPNRPPLRCTSTWPGSAPSSRAASASRNAAVSVASARSEAASRSRSGASATGGTVPVGRAGQLRCAAMADTTGWVWDERYAWHDARGLQDSAGPEALFEPEPSLESGVTKRRMRNLVDASGLLAGLVAVPPRAGSDAELERVHEPAYIERIRSASAAEGGDAGNWTPFGRATYDIAALAAGGCIAAVDAVLDGTVRNAYALVRPPGHHAGPAGGSGYCIFSNVALAALHLRRARGVDRIAIIDWDVHHGNGTQATFWRDPSVLAISLHQA